MSLSVVKKLLVVNAEVDFDLVDDGLDGGLVDDLASAADVEVADTNVADLALLDHFLHDAVGGHEVTREVDLFNGVTASAANRADLGAVGVEESDGPVHEVQVEVVCAEILQSVIEGLLRQEHGGEGERIRVSKSHCD